MLCLNCGRQVEFVGNVCPWCGAQKLQSQNLHITTLFWGLLGTFLGAGIGWEFNNVVGAVIGGIIGMVGGTALGIARASAPLNQNVKCPLCRTDLVVDKAKGPNYNCPKCGGLFHLQ